MFNGCSSLTSLNISNFNTENIQYMDEVFQRCPSLKTLDVSHFNIGKDTIMISI